MTYMPYSLFEAYLAIENATTKFAMLNIPWVNNEPAVFCNTGIRRKLVKKFTGNLTVSIFEYVILMLPCSF